MKRPARRLLVTLVALVCLTTGVAVPASAGTLTGATFSAPSGWNSTGASNARYDWGFTPATTSTLSKVTASVPPGTGGKNRYLELSSAIGNNAVTPDSAANSITGDIDIRVRGSLASWSSPGHKSLMSKMDSASQRAYRLMIGSSGELVFNYSPDGSNSIHRSSLPANFANNSTHWVRVTFDVDVGGNNSIAFFTSEDGLAWAQIGSTQVNSGIASIYDSTSLLEMGSNGNGATNSIQGRIYYAEVRNGIGGTVVNKFDPNEAAAQSPSSWASSTGETWTVNRSGTNMPADIATDLNVGPVEGLPSGGTANYRFIDGVATYNLPSPTSVNAGTSVKLNLGGFTNTATPGSYTSTIRTYDNASTPAINDSATTSALTFVENANSANATVVVDPSLTFTLSGQPAGCSGSPSTSGTTATATSVGLGRLSTSATSITGQNLLIGTNAANGAAFSATYAQPLRSSSGATLADTPVGYGAANQGPFPAVGTEAFGYRMSWWTTPNTWAALYPSTPTHLFQTFGPTNVGSFGGCISYRAQAGTATSAGSYAATIRYTATARY